MLDHAAAAAAVSQPGTPAAVLAQIAAYPDLRVATAYHPNVYPALLDWLVAQGDPAVGAAVGQVRARRSVQQVPGPPQAYYHPAPQEKSGVWRAFETMTGGEGETIVHFTDLFRDTFKKHSRQDLDALLYSGTQAADHRPRLPWLYARVFGLLGGSFLVLWLCYIIFIRTSGNLVPGVIFMGALAVPATVMVFFWEFDQARNVSMFDILKIFFLGGSFALLVTFIVDAIATSAIPGDVFGIGASFGEAVIIGFTEELAKVVVVFVLVRKLYGCLISNGLLVGAIVGTGFAVFETMGYGLSAWANDEMEWVLLNRGVLSIGGHVAWTAISGAAIMVAQRKGTEYVSLKTTDWGKFIALFCVPFVLHTLWDFVCYVVPGAVAQNGLLFGLIVVAWVFIVRLINSGLRQYAGLLQGRVG